MSTSTQTIEKMASAVHYEEVLCNLCGSNDHKRRFYDPIPEEVLRDSSHFLATTDQFGQCGQVVECRKCGLVYTNPRLRFDLLMQGYEENQDGDYVSEGESRSINAYFCLASIRRYAKTGRFLDLGCAHGFLLNAARIHFDVTGIEPSLLARRYAQEKLHINVAAATLEEADFPEGHFDVVSMVDVIEHVPDPLTTLRQAQRVLKKGGVLYLVTPDISGLAARILRGKWWGLRPAHVYYFDRRTMAAALAAAGFEIVECRSFGRIFTYGYWASRLENYPRPISKIVYACIDLLGIRSKFVYIDTRDSMQVIARKK